MTTRTILITTLSLSLAAGLARGAERTQAQATTPSARQQRREARRIVRAGGVAVRPTRQQAWAKNTVMSRSFAAWNHQAGPDEHGENTTDGFAKGLDQGLLIDTDLQTTRDGVLVMHHDPETGRHTDVAGVKIGATDWATLEREVHTVAPDGSRHPLARFDDLVGKFPDQPLSVEVKSMDAARALVKLVAAKPELKRRAVFYAFSDEAVRHLRRELGPDAITGLATKEGLKLFLWSKVPGLRSRVAFKTDGDVLAFPITFGQLGPGKRLPRFLRDKLIISRSLVDTAHRNGLKVYGWTVNDGGQMRALLERGVDGLYSNAPSVLAEAQHDLTHAGAP